MKKLFRILICLTILSLVVTSCKKPNNEGGVVPQPGGGTMQSVFMQGKVTDIDGKPISGVLVSTGSESATTESDGTFCFSKVFVIDKRTVIKFEKNGYFTLTRSGLKQDEMYMTGVLHKKENTKISVSTTFSSEAGAMLKVDAGMKVNLKASSIMRADGSAFNGTVKADMIYLDPNEQKFTEMMPGSDLAALDGSGKEVILVSWGMTNVLLTDESGRPLQIKKGTKAETVYPVPAGMENNPPPTIPLWYFDEDKGIWIEDGIATYNEKDGVYVGEVSHFSWHNLDKPEDYATIVGKVTCQNGNPVAHVQVVASGAGGSNAAFTDNNGGYSIRVPADTPCTLLVSASNWGGSDSKSVPGLSARTVYTASPLIVRECPVTIKGRIICENNNQPIGYIKVFADASQENQAKYTNMSGEYVFQVPQNTSYTIKVMDKGAVYNSHTMPPQPGGTIYNVPDLKMPCEDDGGDDPGTWVSIKEASIKYIMPASGDDYALIYTWKDNGLKFRYDVLNDVDAKESKEAIIINHFDRKILYGYNDDEGGVWFDDMIPYDEQYQMPYAFQVDESTLGPSSGTVNIAGKTCKVYTWNFEGVVFRFAVWQGLIFSYEMNGELFLLAVASTFNVPDVAFTKTLQITWLN